MSFISWQVSPAVLLSIPFSKYNNLPELRFRFFLRHQIQITFTVMPKLSLSSHMMKFLIKYCLKAENKLVRRLKTLQINKTEFFINLKLFTFNFISYYSATYNRQIMKESILKSCFLLFFLKISAESQELIAAIAVRFTIKTFENGL